MAHHTLVRASQVAWQSGVVTDTEWWKLDLNLFKSINGDDGGVWAPVAPVVLGGAGLEVSGPFSATGTSDLEATEFHGDVNILTGSDFHARGDVFLGNDSGDVLEVEATTDFNAHVDFNEEADFLERAEFHDTTIVQGSGSSFSAYCDVTLGLSGDQLDVGADASFGGDVTFDEGFTSDGDAVFNGVTLFNDVAAFNNFANFGDLVTMTDGLLISSGGIEVHGSSVFTTTTTFSSHVNLGSDGSDDINVLGLMILNRKLAYTDAGRVPLRPVIGPDGDHTYTVAECNTIHVPVLSSSITYTISDSGATDGDFFDVSLDRITGGHQVDVRGPAGSLGKLFSVDGGETRSLRVVRIGGTWRTTLSAQDNPMAS